MDDYSTLAGPRITTQLAREFIHSITFRHTPATRPSDLVVNIHLGKESPPANENIERDTLFEQLESVFKNSSNFKLLLENKNINSIYMTFDLKALPEDECKTRQSAIIKAATIIRRLAEATGLSEKELLEKIPAPNVGVPQPNIIKAEEVRGYLERTDITAARA